LIQKVTIQGTDQFTDLLSTTYKVIAQKETNI